ncbi:GNAT family N-acetyltransferase [Reinekea sp.]|jgi:RimJ/RimL family protein N-acetyltransferase|uniref:GNAT family N-acetyltransferase n=1 Tax=Reinekea sp. TaxID=1970455 RepID=UPI003989248D
MWFKDVVLESNSVTLSPLRTEHAEALVSAASDGNLWELWYTSIPNKESVGDYIRAALAEKEQGLALPFVVIDRASGKIIGSTRFCHADIGNQRVEIGYTWYSKSFQRSSINTECKLLLLSHAFETLDAIAVEFRTHWHNQASRNAIARLGAKQDGILRNHQKTPEGLYRDTVVFSIINLEWTAVKTSLQHRLARHSG